MIRTLSVVFILLLLALGVAADARVPKVGDEVEIETGAPNVGGAIHGQITEIENGSLCLKAVNPHDRTTYYDVCVDIGSIELLVWSSQENQTTSKDIGFYLIILEGSLNGPRLPGVRVTGQDGAGNRFERTTEDSGGIIAFRGAPGTWHFEASKDGYQIKTWDQKIIDNAVRYAFLVKAGSEQESVTENKGKIYFLSLHYINSVLYMILNSIKVTEGYAPDYRAGGDWYFQLIDRNQHVLEEKHFSFSSTRCSDYIDENGKWSGGCQAEEERDLELLIPWHPDAWMITVYDGRGFVRFGPYDVSNLSSVEQDKNTGTQASTFNVTGSSLQNTDKSNVSINTQKMCTEYPDKCLEFVGHQGEEAKKCYENEVVCLDQALSQDPNNSEYWYHKGNALHMLKRYNSSIGALDRATALDLRSKYSWNEKGVVYEQLNNFNEAIKCFNKAIEIDPTWSVPRDNMNRVLSKSQNLSMLNFAKKGLYS